MFSNIQQTQQHQHQYQQPQPLQPPYFDNTNNQIDSKVLNSKPNTNEKIFIDNNNYKREPFNGNNNNNNNEQDKLSINKPKIVQLKSTTTTTLGSHSNVVFNEIPNGNESASLFNSTILRTVKSDSNLAFTNQHNNNNNNNNYLIGVNNINNDNYLLQQQQQQQQDNIYLNDHHHSDSSSLIIPNFNHPEFSFLNININNNNNNNNNNNIKINDINNNNNNNQLKSQGEFQFNSIFFLIHKII
jgi:hypothetical protein